MGMLCREFEEEVRGQLEENNRRLWQMIEDERNTAMQRLPMISARRLQSCGDIREILWNLFRKICLIKREMMEMLRGGMLPD